MKVLHLIYDHINNPWVGGGGAVRVYEICRRLTVNGHKITIVSGKYPKAHDYTEGRLEYRFIGTDTNYILSTFLYAVEAAKFVKRHGNEFDVIVEDFAPWNPLFSKFLTNKPVILHVNHKEGKGILKRWSILGMPFLLIEVFYPRFFNHVTALSEWTKKKIKIPDAAVVPAGIGIVCEKVVPFNRNKTDDYIIYIGRLHIENKGLDTLLAAMQRFDTKLRLIGRGRDEKQLKEMAARLKLKNVEFIGFLDEDEKIKALKNAQLLVLPSRFEGWGIVVLEAAACGKPVIVSDIPELRYAVDAGFGLSFKTGNSQDLAAKICYLLENKSLRNEMGQKGRKYAKNFTWNKIAEDYESYLINIINQSP